MRLIFGIHKSLQMIHSLNKIRDEIQVDFLTVIAHTFPYACNSPVVNVGLGFHN